MGWEPRALQQRMQEMGLWPEGEPTPPRPKEAMEWALHEKRIPRSSAIYANIARRVSLRACRDPQFQKLMATLKDWFAV